MIENAFTRKYREIIAAVAIAITRTSFRITRPISRSEELPFTFSFVIERILYHISRLWHLTIVVCISKRRTSSDGSNI